MGMTGSQPSNNDVTPDMNVTPLVDVVLVLLIIFMIITPQLDNKVPVELPPIQNPDAEPKGKLDPVEISISRDGKLFIERDEYPDTEALKQLLSTIHAAEPNRRVVIRADKDAPFRAARPVFKIAKELGFPGAALMVGKPAGTGN